MNKLQVFDNPEFGKMRSIQIDGEPWFVGKDVAAALGYQNPNEAIQDHVDDEDKLNSKTLLKLNSNSTGLDLGQRGNWLINESGVYSLIFGSKLEGAKRFKRWVTNEVLPSIRKTGSYTLPGYASISKVIELVEYTREKMKAEGKEKTEIAHACREIADNYGVFLPSFFTDDESMTEQDWDKAIDFIYSQPKGHQPSYQDFIANQSNIRQLRGRKPKRKGLFGK